MSYRGAEYATDFIKKIKVEIIAADDLASRVVKTIRGIAGTGRKEDCRILVLSFVDAY
jgi:nitrogen regulatory protein PII